jgi:hypothetical protein
MVRGRGELFAAASVPPLFRDLMVFALQFTMAVLQERRQEQPSDAGTQLVDIKLVQKSLSEPVYVWALFRQHTQTTVPDSSIGRREARQL